MNAIRLGLPLVFAFSCFTSAAAADSEEACAQIIVVAYKGANHAAASLTRPREEAEKRARGLLRRLKQGADFAELAESSSDAKSSAPRAGIIGAWSKADWPALHGSIRDTVFALAVGDTAKEPVPADYGFTIVRRCPVEKARSRHILVRYKGAKNAEASVTRSKEEAETRAKELLKKLAGGADFGKLAKAESEDSSKDRGGDIGSRPRGVLALAYEQALFGLTPNSRSGVVETEFGFHIIERLPDAP